MRNWRAALTAVVMLAAILGAAAKPVFAQNGGTTYVVQPGDNLYRISLKFGVTMDALQKANGIVNPDVVFVGQTLKIPASSGTATPFPLSTLTPTSQGADATAVPQVTTDAGILATNTPTSLPPTLVPTAVPTVNGAATAAAPVQNPGTYTVQTGDNLYRIALKFGTTTQVLMQLNNISNQNLIYVGQVLKLPGAQVAGGPSAPSAAGTAINTAGNIGFQFGIVASLTGQDANAVINEVKDLGMGWVKVPVQWRTLEATQGTIDATTLDAQIDALSASGLKIMLTVTSAPDWARATNAESGPPADFNKYANFVGALATRYKGKVHAYEVWSNPNLRREWNGRPLSAASYVEMLRLAYNAIKQSDSNALVVSAGLSPTGFNDGVNAIDDRLFLRQAYAAGLAAYSDAIGVQPNGWANPPDSTCCTASPGVGGWFNHRSFYFRDTLKDYRDIMNQSSDSGTYLWVTEFGWGSSEAVVTDPSTVDQNYGYVNFTSQAEQGQYITRAYELARTLGYVGPMFAFNLNYCQVSGNNPLSTEFRGCYYSLLDTNGGQRPAYAALKAAPKQ
jgi:polysaccharide biosynthesis protein PslG